MMFLKIKVSQKHPSYFRNQFFSEMYCCNEVRIQFLQPTQYFIFLFVKLWGRHSDRMKMIDYDMRIYGFQAVSYILLIPIFRKIKTDCLWGLVIENCLCHWQIKNCCHTCWKPKIIQPKLCVEFKMLCEKNC